MQPLSSSMSSSVRLLFLELVVLCSAAAAAGQQEEEESVLLSPQSDTLLPTATQPLLLDTLLLLFSSRFTVIVSASVKSLSLRLFPASSSVASSVAFSWCSSSSLSFSPSVQRSDSSLSSATSSLSLEAPGPTLPEPAKFSRIIISNPRSSIGEFVPVSPISLLELDFSSVWLRLFLSSPLFSSPQIFSPRKTSSSS